MKLLEKKLITQIPKCTQKQKAEELGCSDSTNKLYRTDRNEIQMDSPDNGKNKKKKDYDIT